MRVIDADGHVEESQATFSDKYLEPAFRSQRPQPVGRDGLVYWMIDEQLFPRRVGRGCHNLGTPVSIDGNPARHSIGKPDSPESMELSDLKARLQSMDEEDIAVQVIYPTLFLAYPLTANPSFATALTSAYNRFMGDRLNGQERLRWVAVANLDDIPAAVKQVREAKRLGASGVMILGTAGDRLLDDESLSPFYDAVAEENLPLAVHVGWSCPPLSNLYTHIYPSGVIPFCAPVLMGFASFISGGLLDRYPQLRVAFLEAGSLWIHFMLDRLEHRYKNSLDKILPQLKPKSARSPMEYIRSGNLYFSAEIEDSLLPQVLGLVGDGQILFGSDMPHGDRERFAGRMLKERKDLSESAKRGILETNPLRYYGLS